MTFNKNRLKFARMRRELTMKALAEKIGLDSRSITAFENGEFPPSDETLKKISLVLKFPKSFFVQDDIETPSPENVSFRSMSRMTAKRRDAAICGGSLAIALNDWIEEKFTLPKTNIIDLRGEPPEEAAIMLRQYWKLGNLPIENMVHLLEAHGIRVFSLDERNAEVDAFSLWRNDTPFIFLNTQKTTERSRFDAAHELGHLVLHKHGLPKGRDIEKEADNFASAFLMPKESIIASEPRVICVDSLIRIKSKWIVSVAALAYRLHKLGRITDWQYRTICIDMTQLGYRGASEPNPALRENSKVLEMVMRELWNEGITKQKIAKDLDLYVESIEELIFGLVSKNETEKINNIPRNEIPKLRVINNTEC